MKVLCNSWALNRTCPQVGKLKRILAKEKKGEHKVCFHCHAYEELYVAYMCLYINTYVCIYKKS